MTYKWMILDKWDYSKINTNEQTPYHMTALFVCIIKVST